MKTKMPSKKPNKFHSSFKFKVVLESYIKGNVSEVARQYGVNPNQLSLWRTAFNEKGPMIYDSGNKNSDKQMKKKITDLENLIGKKEIEINLLKKYLDFYAPPDGN